MRRSRAPRLALAAGLGSLLLVLFYFQSSLSPASEDLRSTWQGKAGRSPLQALYESDQFEQSTLQAVHQQRREMLSNICSRYTRKRRLLRPDDLRHLVVDDTHGLLYCYVPKVACTNWKRVMMVLTGQGKYRDPLEIPAHEAHVPSNLRTLSEYSVAEINARLRTYLKFVFVREPLERLVSAYRNKFTLSYNTAFHKRYGTKIVRRHRPQPSQRALAPETTCASRSSSTTCWTRARSRRSPSTSTGSGCTRSATPASSTTTWWASTRPWPKMPSTSCSWWGPTPASSSRPRPRPPGQQTT
uniref:Carbohydrate sulfotransferase n=1 Tax=Geospiza parvula TaxID=87175 RepID=A0A8C3NMJ9_GEOPR